ncbi:hypothetical protein F0562_022753 [Nyssa sinensis]|uniref:2Fe-2S ferredoxin-type domain-containing protein n=1 Tax=Nyssa sinensis TaxID=561372 RepID=A0A5J5BKA5_9ASTE|nr:hypothetical protein F0562_022753 [Nyssa sinensis]
MFVDKDGEKHIKVPIGMSMLEAAHENDIDLEGACEGSLACSTCHVIIMDTEYYNKLEDPTDEENDMLDLAFGLTETSRLGCQVIAGPQLHGIRLALPTATSVNFQRKIAPLLWKTTKKSSHTYRPGVDLRRPLRPNGRITVTVAAAPPQNTLTLALPIQQPRATGNGGGGGREDCWSEGATSVLIDAWGERYLELSRGNLKQKHWKDVADIVSSRDDYTKPPKTDIQCKNRIDTVKKKYKLEKAKIAGGGGPSKWPFFERLDQLIGPTAKMASGAGAGAGTSSVTPSLSSGGQKVPMGIPVGFRSVLQIPQQQKQQQQKKQKQQFRRRAPVDSDSSQSEPEPSPDSTDSFPPETYARKRPRIQRELNSNTVHRPGAYRGKDRGAKEKNWGNSVGELTRAILKFGEAYEQAESSKLQQLVEMEKQRMKFAKELELQRMQFFMKTQLELSQLKHRRVGNSNHHNNNNNNSDSSS